MRTAIVMSVLLALWLPYSIAAGDRRSAIFAVLFLAVDVIDYRTFRRLVRDLPAHD